MTILVPPKTLPRSGVTLWITGSSNENIPFTRLSGLVSLPAMTTTLWSTPLPRGATHSISVGETTVVLRQ